MLLDEGDHRSLLTLYSAELYFPNYPALPLQAVAATDDLLDFSRVRVIELRFKDNSISVLDTSSGMVMLRLPLPPKTNFNPK